MINTDGFYRLDEFEKAAVKWQYNLYGGFYAHLWKAIQTADSVNLDRLASGFPTEVQAYRLYTTERGWWDRTLQKLGA